jgi:hypothetical protein
MREGLQLRQRLRQMADSFAIGIAPQRIVSRLVQIDHRPWGIPPPRKVHGQFCSDLLDTWTIPRLQPHPDLAVPSHPPTGRHPFVQHFLIEVVDEVVARCHRGLGTLYATTGQREQARIALSTAIEMYRSMDMIFWLPQAEATLAQVEAR